MPFAYYGAKHGLASKYPKPRHRVVVEPFAGSAAYSVHHAANLDHVILIDLDPRVVELWRWLQGANETDVDYVGMELLGERFSHDLLRGLTGGSAWPATTDRAVTPRCLKDWPSVRNRIVRALPHIRNWQVINGTYADAPDIEATWFIDPPYQSIISTAGNDYSHGQSSIDFTHLGEWCRTRPGFTMVCEQSPAEWLPFHPFATQSNTSQTNSSTRHEVIWRSDMEQPSLWGAA